ncbi:MAG: NADH-quinone oxidoreductase subunit C [Planctomycetes bacterium]|nr:NADH-quinone oxidoreductase subunit C [Planctomycetota bacterium]
MSAPSANALDRVQSGLAALNPKSIAARDGMPAFEIEAEQVREACRLLRDACGFETNTFVTAIDHFPAEPRFELFWQFLSVQHNDRVRLSARVTGAHPHVASIGDLYPGTQYSERECYDMFGVVFDGHTSHAGGLKRLLMPEGYDHFPLRKDFPHQGIEPDKLYNAWFQRRFERHEREHADV